MSFGGVSLCGAYRWTHLGDSDGYRAALFGYRQRYDDFGFGVAGLISPSTFGYPFLCSIALLLAGAVLVNRIRPDRPFEEPSLQK